MLALGRHETGRMAINLHTSSMVLSMLPCLVMLVPYGENGYQIPLSAWH